MRIVDKIVTPSSDTVVTLDLLKDHLKISGTDEDLLLTAYLKAAQGYLETFTGRQFLPATWSLLMCDFPGCRVELIHPPVDESSITVSYYDSANNLQTLDPAEYTLYPAADRGKPFILFDGSMPAVYDRPDAVVVRYSAGYTVVPDEISVAVLLQAASIYENRQDEVSGNSYGSVTLINGTSKNIIYPYKVLTC